MLTSFNDISPTSRLWIHQSNRPLTSEESALITNELEANLTRWQAHQFPLHAAVSIFADHFVIIAVDEAAEQPSGCSIDTLSHWIKDLGQRLEIDFFDRSVLFLNAHNQLRSTPISGLKAAVSVGFIEPNTQIYNTLAKTKDEWIASPLILAKDSWLKRYFTAQQLLPLH